MKKGFIAFAIYFGCVVIAATLDMLGLPIIPIGGDVVSPVLMLATHLPAWLYLIFSKADASSGMFAFCFELSVRIPILDSIVATISVLNALGWMIVIGWLYSREHIRKWHCDLKKDGEPCEFCSFRIAKENVEKGEGNGDIL